MEKTCEKVIIITKCVEKSDVIYIPNCLCKKSIEIPKIYLPLIIKTDIHTQPLTILRVIKYKTSLRYIHNNVEKIIHNKKNRRYVYTNLCIAENSYKYQKCIPQTINKVTYITTDYPAADNNKFSTRYIHKQTCYHNNKKYHSLCFLSS